MCAARLGFRFIVHGPPGLGLWALGSRVIFVVCDLLVLLFTGGNMGTCLQGAWGIS